MLLPVFLTTALLLSTASAIELAISQNFADPCLIWDSREWYAFSTTNNGINLETCTVLSDEDALPTLPAWVYADFPAVAAPDVVQLGGNNFVIYFDATPIDNTWRRCVGAASSDNPTGPYTPVDEALVCGDNLYGFIDASGFYDAATGKQYLLYKLDGTNPGKDSSLPPVPAQIFIQEVSATDGVTLIGSATEILQSVGNATDYGTVEAPSLISNPSGQGYILFYSSGLYQNSTYTVSYATAGNVTGPYTKQGVLLKTGADGLNAPGGADVGPGGVNVVFHANQGSEWNNVRYMYTGTLRVNGETVEII